MCTGGGDSWSPKVGSFYYVSKKTLLPETSHPCVYDSISLQGRSLQRKCNILRRVDWYLADSWFVIVLGTLCSDRGR